MRTLRRIIAVAIFFTLAATGWAQWSEAERTVVRIEHDYEVDPNITYRVANNYEAKLDVYRPQEAKTPVLVMYIHGGGWLAGTKEEAVLNTLPYLQMGFAVVNVEYRLGKVSLAPAAVEDCLCALHWIGRNAKKYNFDLGKVIVTGASAGGHLALTTAMIPTSAGFENECVSLDDEDWQGPWTAARPKVAAVINWFGITDVADMLQGPNLRSYAISWLGSVPNREDLAKRLSPLNLRAPRTSSHSYHSWRCRRERSLLTRHAVARGPEEGGGAEPVADDSGRQARRLSCRTGDSGVRDHPQFSSGSWDYSGHEAVGRSCTGRFLARCELSYGCATPLCQTFKFVIFESPIIQGREKLSKKTQHFRITGIKGQGFDSHERWRLLLSASTNRDADRPRPRKR